MALLRIATNDFPAAHQELLTVIRLDPDICRIREPGLC